MVIAVAGIHSVVRPSISADTPTYAGHHVYRGMVTRENALALLTDDTLRIWVDRERDMDCLFLPLCAGKFVAFDIGIRSLEINMPFLGEGSNTQAF